MLDVTLEEAMLVRDSDVRREYARSHPVLIGVTAAAAIGGLLFIFVPSILALSSVGQILSPGLRIVWAISYLAGGSGVLGAIWLKSTHPYHSVRLEATALCLLASCYIVYSIAIFYFRGAAAGAAAASVFAGLALGLIARAWTIVVDRPTPWRSRKS